MERRLFVLSALIVVMVLNAGCVDKINETLQDREECGDLNQTCCYCNIKNSKTKTCNNDGGQRLTCDSLTDKCIECGGLYQVRCYNYCIDLPEVEVCDMGLKPCSEGNEIQKCRSCGCTNQKPCNGSTPCYGYNDILKKGYCVDNCTCGENPVYIRTECKSDEDCRLKRCPWQTCVNGYCFPHPP